MAAAETGAEEYDKEDAKKRVFELIRKYHESKEHEERCANLEKKGVIDNAGKLKERARKKSKELMDGIAETIDKDLEVVFKEFDTDGSETLDFGELQAAFKAAGLEATDADLHRAIKALDTNGDGEIDANELRAIAF